MMKLGGHLGFQDSIDCCWSVQLEIDFGLSVGRHCQCEGDQQQPIFSHSPLTAVIRVDYSNYNNQCFLKTVILHGQRNVSQEGRLTRDPSESVKHSALLI